MHAVHCRFLVYAYITCKPLARRACRLFIHPHITCTPLPRRTCSCNHTAHNTPGFSACSFTHTAHTVHTSPFLLRHGSPPHLVPADPVVRGHDVTIVRVKRRKMRAEISPEVHGRRQAHLRKKHPRTYPTTYPRTYPKEPGSTTPITQNGQH